MFAKGIVVGVAAVYGRVNSAAECIATLPTTTPRTYFSTTEILYLCYNHWPIVNRHPTLPSCHFNLLGDRTDACLDPQIENGPYGLAAIDDHVIGAAGYAVS
jgi:hypothetical protein